MKTFTKVGGIIMKENLVLTISRQYGAGGRELAQILADKLGVKLYDRQIVHIAAAKLGINDLSEEELLQMENQVKPLSMSFIPFHSFGTHMGESSHGMFLSESSAIKKLAKDGSCVILGRCGDYVLRNNPNCVNIFIYADMKYRKEQSIKKHGIDPARAEHIINKTDKSRANYYSFYSGQKWGMAENYDLCIDSSKIDEDKIVELIAEYIKLR